MLLIIIIIINRLVYTRLHPFNGPLSGTTRVSRYQKGKTNLDFTGARDSERQWHQLDHMQVCTSLQTDNHASTPPLSFLQAGCPSCRPTNSVKALKVTAIAYSGYKVVTSEVLWPGSVLVSRGRREGLHVKRGMSLVILWLSVWARCRLFAYGPADATASQG